MDTIVRLDTLPAGTVFRLPGSTITGTVDHVSDAAVSVTIRRRAGGAAERTEWAASTEVAPGPAGADAVGGCLCHAPAPDPVRRRAGRAPVADGSVTFGQFARAGRRLGWSLDFLVKCFRSKIDDPRELFERIFDPHDRHAAMVIPYASLLALYHREVTARRPPKSAPTRPVVATSFSVKTARGLPKARTGMKTGGVTFTIEGKDVVIEVQSPRSSNFLCAAGARSAAKPTRAPAPQGQCSRSRAAGLAAHKIRRAGLGARRSGGRTALQASEMIWGRPATDYAGLGL
jgi:hypothetical protein